MRGRAGGAATVVVLAAAALVMSPLRSVQGLHCALPRLPGAAGRGRARALGASGLRMRRENNETPAITMPEPEWRARAGAHRERVRALLEPGFLVKRERSSAGADGFWALDAENPIYNFLLRYYNIRGAAGTRRLARWSPGPNVILEGASEDDAEGDHALLHPKALVPAHESVGGPGLMYSPSLVLDRGNISSFQWYREVLRVTQGNAPVLNCFGLHEWAMQYQPPGAPEPPSRKYQELPLRVTQEVINAAVERRGVRCTHVDALRFFAEAAKPLNLYGDLSRKDQIQVEQPACVHASMDLLKIALKIAPLAPSESVADALEVAIASRRLDVAASPYDASQYLLKPIPIETLEGRVEYKEAQYQLMKSAEPVRAALLSEYSSLLDLYDTDYIGELRVPGG